jgi:hypothetical protein
MLQNSELFIKSHTLANEVYTKPLLTRVGSVTSLTSGGSGKKRESKAKKKGASEKKRRP